MEQIRVAPVKRKGDQPVISVPCPGALIKVQKEERHAYLKGLANVRGGKGKTSATGVVSEGKEKKLTVG